MESVSRKAFRVVRKTRVSEEVIGQVRDLIASGRLKVGDRLPAERELAAALQVGRSTVREAIRAMESMGILEARPGEGTFLISDLSARQPDPDIANAFKSWDNQRKLFEVRMVFEPELAALAARRATQDQIVRMREILDEQEAEVKQGETGIRSDTAFHFLLAQATGNEVLVRIVENLMAILHETREATLHPSGRSTRSMRQHRAILRAIEARDPGAAEKRMREHIAEMQRLVFSTKGWANEPAGGAVSTSPASQAEIPA